MTPIAPHITAFLRERLAVERRASDHTCDSYSYTFQLLFEFASRRRIRCTEPVLPSPVGLTHIGGHDRDAAEVGGADRGLA